MSNNNNQDGLNQLVLRTMLLEGGSGKRVLSNARSYAEGGKSAEDKANLVREIRKEITINSKELMTEDQLSTFIDELTQNM